MIGLLTISVLLIIAGISNSIMDILKFHYSDSVFTNLGNQNWWDESSWKNKYKNRDIDQGEKFLGSTTVFVFVTDAWHFFQMIWRVSMTFSIIIGIFITLNFDLWLFIAMFVGFSCIYLGTFNLFYEKILRL